MIKLAEYQNTYSNGTPLFIYYNDEHGDGSLGWLINGTEPYKLYNSEWSLRLNQLRPEKPEFSRIVRYVNIKQLLESLRKYKAFAQKYGYR